MFRYGHGIREKGLKENTFYQVCVNTFYQV